MPDTDPRRDAVPPGTPSSIYAPTGEHPTAAPTSSPYPTRVRPEPPPRPPLRDEPPFGAGPPIDPGRPPYVPEPQTVEPPPRRSRAWRIPLAIVVAAALLAGGYVAGRAVDGDGGGSTTVTPTAAVPAPVAASGGDASEPVAEVAAAVAPSVVQIETGGGVGSGVIYDGQGLILTAAHVIAGQTSVDVRVADGRLLDGEVVGTNTETDIGVVRIDPFDGIPVAALAIEQPAPGDLAIAVGSPFALEQTVTSGVVSAVDRQASGTAGVVVGVIQTDAPINPGNSGGPLLNRRGEVIGINSFIQTRTGGNVGVGFSVPSDIAKSVADRLVAGDPVEFGFLGVVTSPSPDGEPGALIVDVEAGSPADEADLQEGDLIVEIEGDGVRGSADVGTAVRERQPGDQVSITVVRDGERVTTQATLGTLS